MHSEKVPYYILDLLQQVPSVVVPGLGRFDAIFHPAVVDISRSQIRPPRIEPGFTVEAYEAEEILPTYMHYVSGVEITDAQASIRDFVRQVHQHLSNGQPYTIDKFGTFSKSTSDILHFTPDWDAFNLSFTGLDAIDLEYVKDQPSSHTDTQHADNADEAMPSASETTYEPQPENYWVTDKEVIEPEIISEVPSPSPSTVISDSTSRLWWTILTTALVLITILCVYLAWDIFSNRDRINQYIAITNDSIATNSPDIVFVDTLEFIEEPIPEDTPQITEPVVEPEPEPETITNPCYVVVGAFSNESNVIKMEQRLEELGYSSKKITGSSLTRVAIITSCDQTALQKTLNDARSSINPDSWIY